MMPCEKVKSEVWHHKGIHPLGCTRMGKLIFYFFMVFFMIEDSTHPSVITHEASDTSTMTPVSSVPQISTTASPSDTLAPITVARQESVPQLTNNRILPADYEDIESGMYNFTITYF